MTPHEAYSVGFAEKCAESGVDPTSLAKFVEAASVSGSLVKSAKSRTLTDDLSRMYRGISPLARRAIMASLASGIGTFAMSDGSFKDKALKGLAGGAIGGAATYGLDRSGATDAGIDLIRDLLVHLKTKPSFSDNAAKQLRALEQLDRA